MWKEFAVSLGPIGSVVDALGPSVLQAAVTGVTYVLVQMIAQYGLLGLANMVWRVADSCRLTAQKFGFKHQYCHWIVKLLVARWVLLG